MRGGATVVQYIGELCRYLVAAPPHPLERAHRVRIAMGNGLRPDVWPRFRERFGIPLIAEFYASTEGNGMVMVREGEAGGRRKEAAGLRGPAPLQRATSPADDGAVGRLGLLSRLVREPPFIAQVRSTMGVGWGEVGGWGGAFESHL